MSQQRTATRPPSSGTVPATLVATVIFLAAVAPLATDMYVPAFPRVSAEFGTTASAVQLTLTTFFAGMGLGQLVGGPFSDQRGRRMPRVGGTVLMTVASIACAVAPDVGILMLARFLQGFGGGWAMVIGRAVIVDLAHGSQLVRVLNLVMGIGGVAPIISPLLGAVILQLTGWRMTFWALAALGILMTLCVLMIGGALLSLFGLLVLARPHTVRPGSPRNPKLEGAATP
ncbi:MAG: multidrug transporter CflA [Arthrobacter sp.]|nr:multidrug transporter CflA [Arthrobacter sp.]